MEMPVILAASATSDSDIWAVLFQLLALLATALVIGMLFERFRQSAILGYLIAGMLLGPNGLAVITRESGVPVIAELGVSLLLFAIGLEFSAKRLIRLGPIAGLGGSLQVVTTLAIGFLIALSLGLDWKGSLAIGASVALSSTACVLRLLTDRAELDSVHGRASLGILLLQDIAVVPLVLFTTMLAGGGTPADMLAGVGKALALIVGLVLGFRILAGYVLPPLMKQLSLSRDRELLVLLAVVLAIGSALAAHALNLSPALGAFIAGMMLAESPFATQIRADIGGLRILFITLFFASVGMLGDPRWILDHLPAVVGVTALVIGGKAIVITGVALLFRLPPRYAVATGVTLAQVGEFGVVIAGIAQAGGILDDHAFHLLVSATLATLFATPMLLRCAHPAGRWLEGLRRDSNGKLIDDETTDLPEDGRDLVIVVGYGPSGQRVAAELHRLESVSCLVVDLRPGNVDLARTAGLRAALGDATNLEFLLHHGIQHASVVVIAVPDHRTAVRLSGSIRTLNDEIAIIARGRYHALIDELSEAGATVPVDEEHLTGRRLAAAAREMLKGRHRRSSS